MGSGTERRSARRELGSGSLKGLLLSHSKLDWNHISDEETFRPANACPYHSAIFENTLKGGKNGRGLNPMERFVEEGPEQQHAVFIRADTGELSTARCCTCSQGFQ